MRLEKAFCGCISMKISSMKIKKVLQGLVFFVWLCYNVRSERRKARQNDGKLRRKEVRICLQNVKFYPNGKFCKLAP